MSSLRFRPGRALLEGAGRHPPRFPESARLRAHRWARSHLGGWIFGVACLIALAAAFDHRLALWATTAPHRLVATARLVTALGNSGYMFAVSAAIAIGALLLRRSRPESEAGRRLTGIAGGAAYFFACIAVSGALAQVIKHVVGRTRPLDSVLTSGPFSFHPFSTVNRLASFPSGHTTSAFAAAIALGLMMPRLRGALLLLASAIGISRVLVGQHYPSDVVAGAALGALVSFELARLWARSPAPGPKTGLGA
jgi:membrane-associated phospholipid phosphatase